MSNNELDAKIAELEKQKKILELEREIALLKNAGKTNLSDEKFEDEDDFKITDEDQAKIEELGGGSLLKDIDKTITKLFPSLNGDDISKLKSGLDKEFSYIPKIVVFGQTGVGKSSYINAVYGQKVLSTSNDLVGETREAKTLTVALHNGKKIKVTDVPGLGESEAWDKQYIPVYDKLMQDSDTILWVIDATNRARKKDIEFYDEYLYNFCKRENRKVVFVLNKIDRVDSDDGRDMWGKNNKPTTHLNSWLDKNTPIVKNQFKNFDEVGFIVPISTKHGYNLTKPIMKALKNLPKNRQKKSLKKEPSMAFGGIYQENGISGYPNQGRIYENYDRDDGTSGYYSIEKDDGVMDSSKITTLLDGMQKGTQTFETKVVKVKNFVETVVNVAKNVGGFIADKVVPVVGKILGWLNPFKWF